jgi:PAS domain S-box-containing protein
MIKSIDEKGHFFESKHKRKDGSVYDVEISSNAAMFGSRKLIFCVCRDITRRKEAQLELSRRAMLLDATSDAIMLHDLEGNILYANEAMCLAHGLKREQMHHLDLIDSFIIRLIPFPMRIQEILTNKKVTSELEVRTTDGTVRLIEVRSQIVQFEGQDLVLVIARDITERKKAEEQLVLRATLLDAATDAILLYDTEGNILYANDAMCRSYGMKREQMHNISFLVESLNDPNDYRKRIEQIQQNKTLVFEVEKNHSNGASTQIEVRAQLVQIAGKELILNTARDITKRKKAEQVLLDRERQFRELAESISDVFFAVDKDLKITYWNQASERLTGITTENALGKRLVDIIPDNQRIQYMNDMFLMAIISGHPQHFLSNYTGEANIQEVDVYPTRDGVSVFARDITEQEKTHQKLIESEERLHILFEDAPDAYCLYDLNGKFTDGNRAAEVLSGYARSELIGTTFLDIKLLSRDEDYTKAKLLLEKNGQGEATGPDEVRITRKDGEFRDVEISTIPTMIGGQQMVLAIIRDITERKKMQENLIVTDRLASIGELASGLAHELNNPLTSVIGFAELLLEKELPEEIKENVNYMCREAKRTATIVRNMLTFARKHPISKQSIDINTVISKVLEMRSYEHKINNISDIKNLAVDLPTINADFFQIQQVILNIVINAEYFMKEAHGNGVLTVSSEKSGQNIKISIADNGPGIPEETLNRMFDPFFTTKPVGKGTGLGLSICYGIVTEHNGRIYAESEVGKGTKFVIELPCIN